jgi:phosphoglycerol transferase MdoB-like AlkP superfamily enzyme
MGKINFKIILAQFIGCIFFIQGIQKLYFATQNEKYNCYIEYLKNLNCECFQKLHLNGFGGEFMSDIYLWFFYGFIIGIIIIFIINWKKNRNILNSILLTGVLFSLFLIRFFRNEYVSLIFGQFGKIFTKDFGVQNIIGGITYTLIGSLLLWKSYRIETA